MIVYAQLRYGSALMMAMVSGGAAAYVIANAIAWHGRRQTVINAVNARERASDQIEHRGDWRQ